MEPAALLITVNLQQLEVGQARDKQEQLSRALREDLRRFGRTFSLALLRLKVFWSDVATDRASISDRGRVACNPFS